MTKATLEGAAELAAMVTYAVMTVVWRAVVVTVTVSQAEAGLKMYCKPWAPV